MNLAWIAALFCCCGAAAAQAEALRDAAGAVIMIRRARSAESRQTALSRTFDAAAVRRASPTAAKGRYRTTKNWFPTAEMNGLRDAPRSMPEPRINPAVPSWSSRLSSAVAAAFGPYRTLLHYAWGGAWVGGTRVKNWAPGGQRPTS